VVDTHGFLVYFERMENTQSASMDIAIGKARAAATYRRTTRVFMDAINKGGQATATLPGSSPRPAACRSWWMERSPAQSVSVVSVVSQVIRSSSARKPASEAHRPHPATTWTGMVSESCRFATLVFEELADAAMSVG
jgi:hypothetical protein